MRWKNINIWTILIFALGMGPTFAQPGAGFRKTKLTGDFISEGVAVADLNKDGKTDISFLAHHDSDPAILLFFEIIPQKEPYFREHIIDNDSGAGLNIIVHDMNGDRKPDIVIANKNGVFLFENQMKK